MMTLSTNSKNVARFGTMHTAIANGYVDENNRLFLLEDGIDGQVIRTSPVQKVETSAQNIITFITASGSKYTVTFKKEDFNRKNGFLKSLHSMMKKDWSDLKSTDFGKAVSRSQKRFLIF